MTAEPAQTGKLNVFISYSRDDLGFADQLEAALRLFGFGTMLDRHGITGGEDWKLRLSALVRDADTVVFVLSPSSARSDVCAWEVEEAVKLGKRIIPVVCRPLDTIAPPRQLSDLNYIYFYDEPKAPGSGFGTGQARLVAALNSDLDWLREHTRLLQRASEWETGGRQENRLLSGADIATAKAWAAGRPKDAPEPTVLHYEFIRESDAAEARRTNAERRRLDEIAKFQQDREEALKQAEGAQRDKAAATRTLVRRTTAGMIVALILALAASAAGLYAYINKRDADVQRERAEQNLKAVTEALALLDKETSPKQLAPKLFALAQTYFREERLDQSFLLYTRILAIADGQFGVKSPESGRARTQMGIIHTRQKQYREAEKELSQALAIFEGEQTKDQSDRLAVLSALAGVYRAEGRTAEAAALELKARLASTHVLSIFYGTDRALLNDRGRLQYGADRSRHLSLGRATVTIPKAHDGATIERPWAVKVPLFTLYQQAEDVKAHSTIQEVAAFGRREFAAASNDTVKRAKIFDGHALVYIHGSNMTFDEAMYRTAHITYSLNFDGASFLYSWPSAGGIGNYLYDRESAMQAEMYFLDFLLMVLSETGAKSVNIIAHSIGSQPLLQALRDLRRTHPSKLAQINEIILAAPDVDRDAFEFLAAQVQGIGRGMTMYVSSNDLALNASRTVSGGRPRAGDVPADTSPTVVPGVDTIDVSAMSSAQATFAERSALMHDIENLIRTGIRPPDKRSQSLRRMQSARGYYWRHSPN